MCTHVGGEGEEGGAEKRKGDECEGMEERNEICQCILDSSFDMIRTARNKCV